MHGPRLALTKKEYDPLLYLLANPSPEVSGDPARFFERFRKHNPASDSPGLGLSIVQQICHYYGFALRYQFAPSGAIHALTVDFPPES